MSPKKQPPKNYIFHSTCNGYDVFVHSEQLRTLIAKARKNGSQQSKAGPILVRTRDED